MIILMRKTLAAISSAALYLSTAVSVYATHVPGHAAPMKIPPVKLTPPSGSVEKIDIQNVPQFVITLLFVVGVIAAVAYLIYGGIKWVMSGGDKSGVEAARNHIVAAIVGLIIIAAAFFIISFVFAILGVGNPLEGGFCIPTLTNPQCP